MGNRLSKQFALMGVLTLLCPIAQADNDSPSPLRFWDGSFDKAADATRQVELSSSVKTKIPECPEKKSNPTGDWTEEEKKQWKECRQDPNTVKQINAQAGAIRKEQRIFADVSRVSDVAAVGSVTAMAGSQLFMKDDKQSASLEKVANIQKVAGYANYTTGATDFALGAYAYMSQTKKLEELKQKASMQNTNSPQLQADLQNSIDKTKSAAYSHMLYGAGKAATGYLSMKMAEQNLKQKDKLKSLSENTTNTSSASNKAAENKSTQNNAQSITSASSASTAAEKENKTNNNIAGGSGSSKLPGMDGRSISNLGNKNNLTGGLSAGSAGAPSSAGLPGSTPAETANTQEEEAKQANVQEALTGFEVSLGGGGAPAYRGGSPSGNNPSDDTNLGIFSSIFGAESKETQSVATGINPNQIYSQATETIQGENGGISGNETTLFALVKNKLHKMVGTGRIQGPGEISIKN